MSCTCWDSWCRLCGCVPSSVTNPIDGMTVWAKQGRGAKQGHACSVRDTNCSAVTPSHTCRCSSLLLLLLPHVLLLLLLPLVVTPEDERFLVKTMRKSEMKVLLDMLPAYAAHMEQHPHSLITRFFGLHKLRPMHGRSVSVRAGARCGSAGLGWLGERGRGWGTDSRQRGCAAGWTGVAQAGAQT